MQGCLIIKGTDICLFFTSNVAFESWLKAFTIHWNISFWVQRTSDEASRRGKKKEDKVYEELFWLKMKSSKGNWNKKKIGCIYILALAHMNYTVRKEINNGKNLKYNGLKCLVKKHH